MSSIFKLIGSSERGVLDCRTIGCGEAAECIRDGTIFVCRCPPGTAGSPDIECKTGKNRPTNPNSNNTKYQINTSSNLVSMFVYYICD